MALYRKILIAVDKTSCSLAAAKKGMELAGQLNAQVGLVYVIDTDQAPAEPDLGETEEEELVALKKEAEETLDHLSLIYRGCKLFRFTPRGKRIYESIINTAHLWGADLIIMGTHGRTGLEKLLLGSVAEHVVRHSKIPIMIIPTK